MSAQSGTRDNPSSVKFIARRTKTAIDLAQSKQLESVSSAESFASPGTNQETYQSLEHPRVETFTDHSIQVGPGQDQSCFRNARPNIGQSRHVLRDTSLDISRPARTRGTPSKTTRSMNKVAKHTKGHTPGAYKRGEQRAKRSGSQVLVHHRKGGPELPQKARPPGLLEEVTNGSTDHSVRSAAVSEHSVLASPEPMDLDSDKHEGEVEVLLQPQTRPITLEQLVVEVRTIYEGVVQFEDKAIRIDEEQTQAAQLDPKDRKPMLKDDYMSYIALHKALLHEHHDLCLASQHPAASGSLRQLPARYSIPARMWRHGVHAPLEILRMRLPESREHMIAFILISFNHMTLFLETVPQFEATWLECIGDLGRYRLALAENDEEREIFSGIARDWYRRAIQLNPQISRLSHHCAILAPSFSIEQLSLYGRALTGLIPFLPTRKSITAFLLPVLSNDESLGKQIPRGQLTVLRAHAFLALGGCGSRRGFNQCLVQFPDGLLRRVMEEAAEQKQNVKEMGLHLAIACSASMLQYGATRPNGTSASVVRRALGISSQGATEPDAQMVGALSPSAPSTASDMLTSAELRAYRVTIKAASTLAFGMFSEALHKPKEQNLYPFIHVFFVMIWSFTGNDKAVQELEAEIPWKAMVEFLNTFANAASMTVDILSFDFPVNAGGRQQPLPEDYVLQGLVFAKDYLPVGWTEASNLDLAEQAMEKSFMRAARIQRTLWMGHKIAQNHKWILYQDDDDFKFGIGLGMEGVQSQPDTVDFMRLLPELGQKQ